MHDVGAFLLRPDREQLRTTARSSPSACVAVRIITTIGDGFASLSFSSQPDCSKLMALEEAYWRRMQQSMRVTAAKRKFTPGHFAFMRAVIQGIDLRASWDRYLRVEGEHEDLRKVRSTIARIRGDFAAAARRHAKPGTARLILVDSDKIQEAPSGLPSLADFAAERGLEDFSESEQQAAFIEAYGPGTDAERTSRRARLIRRQLEALQWLERLVAQNPGADDGVSAWFAPGIAARLHKAKLRTLADLVARINGVGARWWTSVPGVGELKAARILEWLRLYEPSIGLVVGSHVAVRRSELKPLQLEKVVARATAVVPFEKFLLPAELDGSDGRFRAPRHQCLLEARNDYEAIAAGSSPNTTRTGLARLPPTAPTGRKPNGCCSGRSSSTARRSPP